MKNTAHRITDENRLEIDPSVAGDFSVVLDKFGEAIVHSPTRLIVFDDEIGVKEFDLSSSSFCYLDSGFFVLSGQLYYLLDCLGPIDEAAITGHNEFYVWDKSRVYYLNGPVKGADASSFCHLGYFWAKDAKACFFQNERISSADPSTFRVIDDTFAVDSSNVYGFLGEVVTEYTTDPIPLKRGYYRVGVRVFFGKTPLPQADVASFSVLPLVPPEEKRRIWASGGPKDAVQEMAVAGFTAYDRNLVYRGAWTKKRK